MAWYVYDRGEKISTHSAHEDGDSRPPSLAPIKSNFNPLRPRGRRPDSTNDIVVDSNISTHSAHEDGDSSTNSRLPPSANFNPLRPRGRRQMLLAVSRQTDQFQPTPPTRTETYTQIRYSAGTINFNPLRPRGRRPNEARMLVQFIGISTHSAHEDGDRFCYDTSWFW